MVDPVDAMEAVRARNNRLWMDIVRLARRVAPEEFRRIARQIEANDAEIASIFRELSK